MLVLKPLLRPLFFPIFKFIICNKSTEKKQNKKNFFEHNRGRPVDLDILLLAIERVPVRFSFRNGLLSGQYISHSGLSSFKLKKILEPLFFFFFYFPSKGGQHDNVKPFTLFRKLRKK